MLRRNVHRSGGHLNEDGSPEVHLLPITYYYGVMGALFFLTIVTVGVSELGLPMPLSIIVAMIVAVMKAGLVASIFMHLAWDSRINTLVFTVAAGWILIFFTLTMVDYLSRDWVNEEQGHFTKFNESLARYAESKDEALLPAGFSVANPNAAAHGHGAHGGSHGDAAGHGKAVEHGDAAGHGKAVEHDDAGEHGDAGGHGDAAGEGESSAPAESEESAEPGSSGGEAAEPAAAPAEGGAADHAEASGH
jgi:cytochrome c oxidase subunit 4